MVNICNYFIDNWRINEYSENIDLICTDCFNEGEDLQGMTGGPKLNDPAEEL